MENQTQQNKPDFKALRLTQNFAQGIGVKKVLTNVPVSKPPKERFFRVHPNPDMVFRAATLELSDTKETYMVSQAVAQVLGPLVRFVELYPVVDRSGNPYFIPIPLPAEDGSRNSWHDSLLQAMAVGQSKWIRVCSNQRTKGYDVYVAQAGLTEPEWPTETLEELLHVAFRGKVITDPEHPLVLEILGRQ